MTVRGQRASVVRAAALVCAAVAVTVPAAAQPSPLPRNEEEQLAAGELAELEARIGELRGRIREWKRIAIEAESAAREAQPRIRVIGRDIARLQERDAIAIPEDADIDELEARLLEAERDLDAARKEASELDVEAKLRVQRRKKLPELLSVAKERLSELETARPPPPSTDPAVTEAQRELETLKRAALLAEIEAYQNEIASFDERGALLSKLRDRATLRIAYYEALTTRLREAFQSKERLAVERDREAAKRLMEELTVLPEGVEATLRDLYQRNEALASLWTNEGGLYDQIDDVSEKLARAEAKVAEIEAELASLAARVEAVGLADSVGVLLRRHRAEAPDVGMYRRFIRMRQEQIGAVQLQQIKLREQREALADIDALVDEAMASVDAPMPPDEREEVEQLLRQLFAMQRRYMDALIEDYETYFQKLVDFDASQQELIDRTKDLLDFIDERILWVPSGKAVQPELLTDGRDAITWLFGPKYWVQLGRGVRDAAARFWPLNIVVLLLTILFFPFARRASRRLERLGDKANSPDCTSFGPTAEALGLTILLALWLPATMAYVGWRLGVSPAATQFTRSVAHGLLVSGFFWGTLRFPRQLARPGGITQAHCGWPEDASGDLWRQLRWFAAVTVPAVFLVFVFEMRGEDLWRESVGRLAFLIAMIATAVFNYLALRPRGSIATVLRARKLKRPWVWRGFQLVAVALPLALCAAAFQGFYWTALQVALRVHLTLVFLMLLVIVTQLVARWSMLADRRSAREAEALEEAIEKPEPTMQVSRWMIGTGVLIGILGAFAIWADLLPATRILQQVELWSTNQTVTVSEVDPSGVERVSTEDQLVPITLADLLRSLLIGVLTLVLIRALPAILEATIYRKRGPGERYAYSTIVKYGVALAGLAIAFDAIGVGWSSIQWLVAAVGLGLGFGLQEIFANFVSGLIILFERPIRVGDTVTVGEVSGTVTKIRIRATWITAFDRKELVVPNKEFVTGRLINWTLSDAVLRIDVPVGIAYGSDTKRAIEVLEKVARESRRVLRDPPPQVLFLGFGDSSLSFELRAFVPNVAQLFATRHELHMQIDQAFREAGIEIAFPQRDLHVRSIPEGWLASKETAT